MKLKIIGEKHDKYTFGDIFIFMSFYDLTRGFVYDIIGNKNDVLNIDLEIEDSW